MAMSGVHYRLLKDHAHLFKRGGALLEIGEANWYGDIAPPDGCDWSKCVVTTRSLPQDDESDYEVGVVTGEEIDLFAIAKEVYRLLWGPAVIDAIDMNGTRLAGRQDLNAPLRLSRQYDVVINHGTAEHIFNIGQVYKSMHDACTAGGYMVHESPFTGWRDHGFYTIQPTLYYDLAAANDYRIVSLFVCELRTSSVTFVESREHCHQVAKESPDNAIIFAVLQKTMAVPFRVPMQAYYDMRLSEAGKAAWHNR